MNTFFKHDGIRYELRPCDDGYIYVVSSKGIFKVLRGNDKLWRFSDKIEKELKEKIKRAIEWHPLF